MTSKKTAAKPVTPKAPKPTIKSLQEDNKFLDSQLSSVSAELIAQTNRLIEREAEIIILRDEVQSLEKKIEQWRVSYNNLYKEVQELRTRNWYQRLFNIKGA